MRYIEPTELVGYLIDQSGKTMYQLNRELGRSPNYLTMCRGRETKISTAIDVARVAGYRIGIIDSSTGDIVAELSRSDDPSA